MKTFSERKGFTPVSEIIQTKGMSQALRNSLWNVLDVSLWSCDNFVYCLQSYNTPVIFTFSKDLWQQFFKRPIDERPDNGTALLKSIRKFFFAAEWYEVYNFLEWVVQWAKGLSDLSNEINAVLEREMSGYRVVSGVVTDIVGEQEVRMLEEALGDSAFEGAANHLRRALELLSDKGNPDYRNSIKESISAVESIAKIVTGSPKATLGDALKVLEKTGKLHPALKEGFLKLYGYASDEGGIRHAMLEEPSIDAADAKYFLLSCTSFVGYLKAQMH